MNKTQFTVIVAYCMPIVFDIDNVSELIGYAIVAFTHFDFHLSLKTTISMIFHLDPLAWQTFSYMTTHRIRNLTILAEISKPPKTT